MPFYSARAELDIASKVDFLPHQGDAAYWNIISICDGLALHFALLNPETDAMGRIISALTRSAVYHVEVAVSDGDTQEITGCRIIAESLLGKPYDFYGAFEAGWDKAEEHHCDSKEFCSGMAGKIIAPIIFGLTPYPNPGKLLMEVCTAKGLPMPKLAAPVDVLGDSEVEWLGQLHEQGKIAAGTMQDVLTVTGVVE